MSFDKHMFDFNDDICTKHPWYLQMANDINLLGVLDECVDLVSSINSKPHLLLVDDYLRLTLIDVAVSQIRFRQVSVRAPPPGYLAPIAIPGTEC